MTPEVREKLQLLACLDWRFQRECEDGDNDSARATLKRFDALHDELLQLDPEGLAAWEQQKIQWAEGTVRPHE